MSDYRWKELREGLQGFGGLKNILVHGYLAINSGQVHDHLLKAPEILHHFSSEVLAWLERQTQSDD